MIKHKFNNYGSSQSKLLTLNTRISTNAFPLVIDEKSCVYVANGKTLLTPNRANNCQSLLNCLKQHTHQNIKTTQIPIYFAIIDTEMWFIISLSNSTEKAFMP